VVLSKEEGVLSFTGILKHVATDGYIPGQTTEQVRKLLDPVLRAGVLRRGLVLRCATCEQVQFQTLDRLAQTWTCRRCDAANNLDATAWYRPASEPTWFYDLHPVARHLLREHGEVPAQLAAFLASEPPQQRRNALHHVEELELVQDGTRLVEIDLVTYDVDKDLLTIAECKSTDRLAKSRNQVIAEVEKKCRAAARLDADRLIFATTAPNWHTSTFGHINDAVRRTEWGPLGPPEVRMIIALGTESARSDVLSSSPRV
jgi:hypothetical protein